MLHHKEAKEASPTFKWGMKKGIGGTHNDIQFYASFTYNGIEYSLYDCVYMLRKNVAEPDIGKLVKIWETPSHAKKVKTVQFFRPAEIHSMLADYVPLHNEIFLACGEGKGLAYLNPLGAICGKCNVVCTSNDKRNTQPSKAELKLADYIFCRTFDVGSCKLSNKFPYAIAGVKVECFFNKKEESKVDSTSKLNVILKEKAGKSKLSLKADKVDELVRNAVENGSCDANKNLLKESKKTEGSFSEGACCTDQDTALKADCAETSSTSTSEEQILKKRKFIDFMHKQSLNFSDSFSKLNSSKMNSLDKDAEGQLIGGTKRTSVSSPKAVIETVFRPEIPWDERMKKANRDGTLVFLENLDPSYTSSEIEDLIWRVFKEKVHARMIERTSFSSPNYGEAFVIFKMKILADLAISELNRRFLLLDGRPIIGRRRSPSEFAKSSAYIGHLCINTARHQEEHMASTSHFSEPNTIEYGMALEWKVLLENADLCWKALHEEGMEKNSKSGVAILGPAHQPPSAQVLQIPTKELANPPRHLPPDPSPLGFMAKEPPQQTDPDSAQPPPNFWGDTPEEEYYASQGVRNAKSYFTTPHGTLFTQSFLPLANDTPVKASVYMTHGYGSDTGWLFQRICISFASWGYAVFAADLLGHGRSDGLHGYLGDMEKVAAASLCFFRSVRESEGYRGLPAFLFGESMGGAATMLMYFQSEAAGVWTGLMFSAPLFVMPENMKPSRARLLGYGLLFGMADTWAVMPDNRMVGKAIKDPEKLRVIAANPRRYRGRPRVGTMRELARVCDHIQANFRRVRAPFFTAHGTADGVTCPSSSTRLYDEAASEDKTVKLYEGMYHSLIQGEPDQNAELVLREMREWIDERVRRYGSQPH